MGRWWPWGFGKEDTYVTPPNRIQLLAERGIRSFEKDELLLRAIPDREHAPGARESSYWSIKSPNQLVLNWTDGFVSVTLDLTRNGDELSGWAHPHFDSGRPLPRIAQVKAHRIACVSQ